MAGTGGAGLGKARPGTAWPGVAGQGEGSYEQQQGDNKVDNNKVDNDKVDNDKNETRTRIHPIDVTQLKKGDYLPPSQIVDICGVEVNNKRYSLELLKIRSFIQEESRNRGNPLLTKGENNGIRILIDDEALDHRSSRIESGEKIIVIGLRDLMLIDTNNLLADRNKVLEHRVYVTGKKLQAMNDVERKLTAVDHIRMVPLLTEEG